MKFRKGYFSLINFTVMLLKILLDLMNKPVKILFLYQVKQLRGLKNIKDGSNFFKKNKIF